MSWTINYSSNVLKILKKTDKQVRNRLIETIESKIGSLDDPRSLGKPLKGDSLWRYRIGDYRVIAEIRDNELVILIVIIGHRKKVYKNL